MLLEVGQFCRQVDEDLAGLIDELSEITNRNSPNEKLAWQKSLPMLSMALSSPSLRNFHLSLGQSGGISVEYKLPAASAWCDAVLLGRGKNQPSAVMIELKDWDTNGVNPTSRERLIDYRGKLISHPSDQVCGYVEYCQNFHSAVLTENASVAGCVFFTKSRNVSVFQQSPYQELVKDYPVFSSNLSDIQQDFPDFLSSYLTQPDFDFAQRFEKGTYAQNRSLVEQIADLVLDEDKTIFVLLDEQRRGFELCLSEVDKIIDNSKPDEKSVIIVEGPPGSGKSVLAAKLWASLAKNPKIMNSVVLTSTSSAQNSNWSSLFQTQSKNRLGRGVIIKATQYNPGLSPAWVNTKREQGFDMELEDWRNNLKIYLKEKRNKMPDNTFAVSIVDEAHALIDPTARSGVSPSGWAIHAGPQAYHIMRSSQISIFLMDPLQSFRDNETTTKENIELWANELGIKNISSIDLGDAQFRCGGSKEYVDWLDSLLGLKETDNTIWDKENSRFLFELVDDPAQLDEKLMQQVEKNKSVRLVATYNREWVTQKEPRPHELQPSKMDFHIPYRRNGKQEYWSRIWNFAPEAKYQMFVQAVPGSMMNENPLSEVGCPYVVRGFDYDYLGVLWLNDLVWRNNHWHVNFENIFESAWKLTLSRAKKERKKGTVGIYTNIVTKALQQSYRILLSRAINGIYVWIEDKETREHVRSLMS